ncbi:MAG: hypothetical protein WBM44_31480 [Waterburya sp.]
MLEPEKLIQIVSAWLEYIRQEEMTNAEVEKGWGSYQKVFDEGVRITELIYQKNTRSTAMPI